MKDILGDYRCIWIGVQDGFVNLWRLLFKDKASFWPAFVTASATLVLAWFSYRLYIVNNSLYAVNNRMASDTEAIQRAFVFINDISGMRLTGGKTIASVDLTFDIKNSGSTPSKHLLTHLSHRYAPDTLPDDFDFPDLWDPGQPHIATPTVVGPQGTSSIGPIVVPAAYISLMLLDAWHLYFWGWLKYFDVFSDTPHVTEFCYELAGFEGNIFSTNSSEAVLPIFHSCPKHNCYDNDCPDYDKMAATMTR